MLPRRRRRRAYDSAALAHRTPPLVFYSPVYLVCTLHALSARDFFLYKYILDNAISRQSSLEPRTLCTIVSHIHARTSSPSRGPRSTPQSSRHSRAAAAAVSCVGLDVCGSASMRKHRPQQVYVHVYKYVRVRARARGAHTALAALFSRISRDVYTYLQCVYRMPRSRRYVHIGIHTLNDEVVEENV